MTIDTKTLSQILAAYAGVTEEEASKFLEVFAAVVEENVKKGEDVEVQGLGNFSLIDTEHEGMRRVALLLSESIKAEVNAPFSFLEPYVISKGKEPEVVSEDLQCQQKPVDVDVDDLQCQQKLADVDVDDLQCQQKLADVDVDVLQCQQKLVDVDVDDLQDQQNSTDVDIDEKQEKKIIAEVNSANEPKKPWFKYVLITVLILLLGFVGYCSWHFYQEYRLEKVQKELLLAQEKADSIAKAEKEAMLIARRDSIAKAYTDSIAQIRKDSLLKVQQDSIKKTEAKLLAIARAEEAAKAAKISHRMKDDAGQLMTFKLEPGERLTLVSLKYFGSKDFWPYIFDANSDKLKTPSNVMSGITLYLPDPTYYNIDANDEQSLKKARQRGHDLLKQ